MDPGRQDGPQLAPPEGVDGRVARRQEGCPSMRYPRAWQVRSSVLLSLGFDQRAALARSAARTLGRCPLRHKAVQGGCCDRKRGLCVVLMPFLHVYGRGWAALVAGGRLLLGVYDGFCETMYVSWRLRNRCGGRLAWHGALLHAEAKKCSAARTLRTVYFLVVASSAAGACIAACQAAHGIGLAGEAQACTCWAMCVRFRFVWRTSVLHTPRCQQNHCFEAGTWGVQGWRSLKYGQWLVWLCCRSRLFLCWYWSKCACFGGHPSCLRAFQSERLPTTCVNNGAWKCRNDRKYSDTLLLWPDVLT